MCGQNAPPNLPVIANPILMQETRDPKTSAPPKLTDEQKRSQAIQIVTSRQNSAYENQKIISSELQRANEELQKATAELVEKQQILSSIQKRISTLLEKLNKSHEEIQDLHKILDVLTASDPSISKQIVQKVTETYEANFANNINNSVSKLFDFNKYN